MYTEHDHTFAVCAYKESPYLLECVQSLVEQSVSTNIIITTSTPNAHIAEVARRFDIPVFESPQPSGIASDWNFACEKASTSLVTIAHQDDIYCREYAAHALEKLNAATDPLIFFTNYGELRHGQKVDDNKLLNTKRLLLKPLNSPSRHNSIFWRRRVLSLGSAICCPSVTLVTTALPTPVFEQGLDTNLDWDAWERFSRFKGAYVYDRDILMYHRIHEESTTTELIENDTRSAEDELMLARFWPRPIAKLINRVYSQGQKSNSL